jgi:esterase/lipase superfamily enzyme
VKCLAQIALLDSENDTSEIFERRKLDQVILVGSDIDRQSMGGYIDDGLLNVSRHLTVYISRSDQALGLSQWLLGARTRLGQVWSEKGMPAETEAFLRSAHRLTLINVTDAEDFDSGNGHAYFRHSPWVASDVLLTLGYGFDAAKRGLIRESDSPIWMFPPDYVERLQMLLPRPVPGYLDDLRD